MTKENSPSHHKTKKQQELEQHEVQQVLNFLTRYGKNIATGVAVAAVAMLVGRGISAHRASRSAAADQLLSKAQTPAELAAVVDGYSSTSTAPAALLQLAKTLFSQGEIERARTQYQRFIDDYSKHDQLPIAQLGLAHCTEAEGNYEVAVKELEAFSAQYADHYLAHAAILARARCLEAAGNVEGARIALEDFLAQNPTSPWTDSAEVALARLPK